MAEPVDSPRLPDASTPTTTGKAKTESSHFANSGGAASPTLTTPADAQLSPARHSSVVQPILSSSCFVPNESFALLDVIRESHSSNRRASGEDSLCGSTLGQSMVGKPGIRRNKLRARQGTANALSSEHSLALMTSNKESQSHTESSSSSWFPGSPEAVGTLLRVSSNLAAPDPSISTATPIPQSPSFHNITAERRRSGSKKIEMMSKEEKQRMIHVFERYDTDKSGSIDTAELVPLLRELGHPLPPSEAAELLRQVDANHNSRMEFEELLQLVLIIKGVAQFRIVDGFRRKKTAKEQEEDEAFEKQYSHQHHISRATEKFHAVLPDASLLKWAWDVLMLVIYCIIFFSVTSLHMRFTEEAVWQQANYFFVPDIIITIPLAIEMVLSCVTAFKAESGQWVDSYAEMTARYVKSWFLPDLISLLPLRLVTSDVAAMIVLAHLRLLRIPRVALLFESSGQVGMTREYVGFFFVFAPAVVILAALICLVHISSIVWLRVLGNDDLSYGTAVYVTMYYFSGVGYGEVENQTSGQEYWSSICCMIALFVNATVVGNIVQFMGQADVEGSRQSKLLQTQAVLRFFGVPEVLQEEILQFQNHVLMRDIQSAHQALIESLPPEIQMNLNVQLQLHVLFCIPPFRTAHETVKIALVQQFNRVVCTPEEYLAVSGEEAQDIIFIHYGFVDLLNAGGLYITTLRNGMSFGDALMFAPRGAKVHHELSAKSIGYTELFVLPVEGLHAVMQLFPAFSGDISAFARRQRIGTNAPAASADEIPELIGVISGAFAGDPEGNRTSLGDSLHLEANPSPATRRRSSALRPFALSSSGEVGYLLGVDLSDEPSIASSMDHQAFQAPVRSEHTIAAKRKSLAAAPPESADEDKSGTAGGRLFHVRSNSLRRASDAQHANLARRGSTFATDVVPFVVEIDTDSPRYVDVPDAHGATGSFPPRMQASPSRLDIALPPPSSPPSSSHETDLRIPLEEAAFYEAELEALALLLEEATAALNSSSLPPK